MSIPAFGITLNNNSKESSINKATLLNFENNHRSDINPFVLTQNVVSKEEQKELKVSPLSLVA